MRAAFFATFLLLLPLAGCRFGREIVNPGVRDMDVSWVVPGKTTRRQVIAALGIPPTVRGMGGVKKDSLRWTSLDTFTATLEAGYIVTPTFERAKETFAEDILIRFDARDVVSLVSRTRTKDGHVELLDWREAVTP